MPYNDHNRTRSPLKLVLLIGLIAAFVTHKAIKRYNHERQTHARPAQPHYYDRRPRSRERRHHRTRSQHRHDLANNKNHVARDVRGDMHHHEPLFRYQDRFDNEAVDVVEEPVQQQCDQDRGLNHQRRPLAQAWDDDESTLVSGYDGDGRRHRRYLPPH